MYLKRFLILCIAIMFSKINIAQERYENEIEIISQQLHSQLTTNNVKLRLGSDSIFYKVALVEIENEDGKSTKLTRLLEKELAVDLAIKSNGIYTVLDRNYINNLLAEKNIPKTFGNKQDFAKNLGRIKAANLMIVGELTNFDNEFKLIFTIIETKEGSTVSGTRGKITASELLKSKNRDEIETDKASKDENLQVQSSSNTLSKSTPNRSVNIGEMKDMDPGCNEKKIGTIVIENKSKCKLVFNIAKSESGVISFNDIKATVEKNDSNPLMGLPEGTYTYYSHAYDENGNMIRTTSSSYSSGSISVIKCKETTIIAK